MLRRPDHSVSPGAPALVASAFRTDSAASTLDALLVQAVAANPGIAAARAELRAARARVGPAGARPDPMLMAGIQNASTHGGAFREPMSMKMVGISQMIPFPGKLRLQARAARDEVAAAEARVEAVRLDVERSVRTAYYDLAFIDRALDIVDHNASVLRELITASEAQYSVGRGAQADILRARTEAARLGDDANALQERRRAVVATLDAVLDRPPTTPVTLARIPERIARAAVSDSPSRVHFASMELGARASDSPLLPLDSLQALAIAHSPMVHAHIASIAAQRARVAFAERTHFPDVDVSLSYGQRDGRPDMFSATVSVPLPLQKGRKQDEEVAEATAELAALEAQHHEMVNDIAADVARRVSDVEHARTQLALSMRAILPQARATLASATANYQVGRVDFPSVLDAQASVFNAETAYYQSLTDFAKALAELERTVGAGVLR